MDVTKGIVFHSYCGNWKVQKGLGLDVVLLNHLTIFVSYRLHVIGKIFKEQQVRLAMLVFDFQKLVKLKRG